MDIFQNRKIVLTRLLVGHTHEDIDAIFGKIWKKCREQHILSPQQYMEMIIEALRNRKIPCEVIDVFVHQTTKISCLHSSPMPPELLKRNGRSCSLYLRLLTFVRSALAQ